MTAVSFNLKVLFVQAIPNILNALLIHKENKFLNEFIEAYEILTGIYTKPDEDELNNILNDPGW